MTLHPRYIPDVPETTAQVAKAAFRKGNRYMQMRDELGTLFSDEQFTDLFPVTAQVDRQTSKVRSNLEPTSNSITGRKAVCSMS